MPQELLEEEEEEELEEEELEEEQEEEQEVVQGMIQEMVGAPGTPELSAKWGARTRQKGPTADQRITHTPFSMPQMEPKFRMTGWSHFWNCSF